MEDSKLIYAPVIITTLCRYEHFKRCVESLARCTGADKTELYVGLDAPVKENHKDGYQKINQYVDTIIGFKAVHVFRRDVNYGPVKNDLDLKKQVEKRFDRYISTEDDNEFSPNFLVYMNKGLELYKDDPKVLAICGYSYPFDHWKNIRGYEYNAYPIHAFCAWGVGCWVKKRISSFVNSESAYQVIHSWRLVYKMFRKKQHITIHRLLFRNKTAYGDLIIRVYCALNDVYCIFPSLSKVRNYGFDGSGLNCKTNSLYVRQEIDTQPYFEFDNFEIREYEPLKKIQDKEYGGTWINRRMCEVEYLFFRMFGANITDIRRFFRRKICK